MIATMQVEYNPIHTLYRSKSALIAATRCAVLKEIRGVSSLLARVAQAILERKLRSGLPPLIEMFPWVLAELTDIPPESLDRLARGWFAVYLYGHLLDERADRHLALTAEEQLLGWVLFQFGLRYLHLITHATQFERQFELHLSSAVKFQLQDLSDRGRRNSPRRARYSAGKNNCLVACAAAVAAATRSQDSTVVAFTKALVPGLQHLDDIADLREDARQGNYTTLLTKAVGNHPRLLGHMSEFYIIEHAVRSGALGHVLQAVQRSLRRAKRVVGDRWERIQGTPSGVFVDSLAERVDSVRSGVVSVRRELLSTTLNRPNQLRLVRRVRRELGWVAQGS